jgi:photosystem II stability/assembly factor-like uncharacterized protein
MTWTKLSSYTGPSPWTIYIDRQQRIIVGNPSSRVYISTDRGSTWAIDTAGIGYTPLTIFCDDTYGNLYAISGTKKYLYRSLGGTQPWTRIDQPVTNQVVDVNAYSSSSNPILASISGDSLLFLGTGFGMFTSSDQGTTWQESNSGINASTTHGYLRTQNGRTLVTTSLGIFYNDAGNPTWTKSYPVTGYFCYPSSRIENIFADGGGNIYSLGSRLNTTSSLYPPAPIKSTDNGTTWFLDTAGFNKVGQAYTFQYFVDENGMQYLTSYQNAVTPVVASKIIEQPWTVDTAGYFRGSTNRSVVSFCSDRRGNMYIGTSANPTSLLLTRPITGGAWVPDTSGLGSTIIYAIVRDKSGNLYAGGFNSVNFSCGIWKKVGSTWQSISPPSNLPGCGAFYFTVDSTNTLFAVFGDVYYWRGVYCTKDGGSTWTDCGFDKVNIRSLVSFGDTTFVVTQAAGIYKLTSNPGTGIALEELKLQQFKLYNNYPNPFNPSTTISFNLPSKSFVSLKVFDLLGREVATIVSEEMSVGSYSRQWNAANMSSGIYFYRLQAGSFTETKKLVLLR